MKELAPDVWLLRGQLPYAINVYLVGDVLIDAARRGDGKLILRQLRDRDVKAHALTHAHPDHQGASHEVCTELDLPLWVGERDADAAERPELIRERQPDKLLNRAIFKLWAGPGHPVARRLHEGDDVAGFTVLDVPGHSAGHVAFWREADRVLIAGDVVNTMHPFTMVRGVREPLRTFTPDVEENRRSIKRIAELEPSLLLVGHGPPVRDPAKLRALADSL